MAGSDPNYQAAGVAISAVDTAAEVEGFWKRTLEETKNLSTESFKQQELPLARIKKIMKLDEDVKMISAEAPVLFAKASEIFISELSLRAWIHTEDNKRRTLQRNDLATAISKFDQYDFLIDIVPRDELKPAKREEGVPRASMLPDQVQYYFQLAQQHQAAMQQQSQGSVTTQQQQPQAQQQAVQGGQIVQQVQTQLSAASQPATPETQAVQTNAQVLQIQSSPQAATAQSQAQQQQTTQVFMQIVTPSGEVQNVPVQLPQAQLQSIQQQLQGKQAGQPIIIQTSMPVSNQSDQDGAQQQQFSNTQPMYQVQQVPQQVFVQQQVEDADGEQTTHVELAQEGSS